MIRQTAPVTALKAHLVEIYLKLHKKLVFLGIRYSRLFIPGYGLNISDFHIIGLIFHKFIKFKLKVSNRLLVDKPSKIVNYLEGSSNGNPLKFLVL